MCENVAIRYEWKCPHCGHRNSNFATVRDQYGSLSAALVYCDIEDGGCDRMVAVKPKLLVQTEVYALVSADDKRQDLPHDEAGFAHVGEDIDMDLLDTKQRAREQMDGLRRGMGLE